VPIAPIPPVSSPRFIYSSNNIYTTLSSHSPNEQHIREKKWIIFGGVAVATAATAYYLLKSNENSGEHHKRQRTPRLGTPRSTGSPQNSGTPGTPRVADQTKPDAIHRFEGRVEDAHMTGSTPPHTTHGMVDEHSSSPFEIGINTSSSSKKYLSAPAASDAQQFLLKAEEYHTAAPIYLILP